MTASPNDVRCANDVCLTAHWANIASLRNEVEQHHFERSEKHHIAVPTDTMLVLDLSGSMDGQVSTLVSAANDAIRQLYDTNRNNRVGVILYSGNEEFGTSTYAQGARVNGEFEFVLYDENGTEKGKVKNEHGAFAFGAFEFDRAGVYVYTVEETEGSLGGIAYDKSVYTVRINVIDDGTGKLRAETFFEKDGVETTGIVFRNAYSLKSYFFNIERTAIIGGCKSC